MTNSCSKQQARTIVLAIAIPIPRAGRLEVELTVINAAGHRRHRTVAGVTEVSGFGPHWMKTQKTEHIVRMVMMISFGARV